MSSQAQPSPADSPAPAVPQAHASLMTPTTQRRKASAAHLNRLRVPPGIPNESDLLVLEAHDLAQDIEIFRHTYYDLRDEYEHLLDCRRRGVQWKPVGITAQGCRINTGKGMGVDIHADGDGLRQQLEKAEEEWEMLLERLADYAWRQRKLGAVFSW